MSNSIIQVTNLSKSYTISHEGRESYTSLRDVIARKTKKIFSFPKSLTTSSSTKEEFWALKDINFNIKPGDRVGIIGRNGAGKSTLLKILSRITEPTTGQIKIKGRVASLLEVGTGFHPELTGRENIFLNGAILGMSRAEIKKHFDAIIDFAEVEKFLDTPVKRYSSGMYVRLAFAVAAHLEPEILIVDEVLAVGDAQFQKKCLGKMEDVSKNEGRTVLFVSHNMSAISTLCNKGIVLNHGRISFSGDQNSAIKSYMRNSEETIPSCEWNESDAPYQNNIKLLSAKITNHNGSVFNVRDEIVFEFVFLNLIEGVSELDTTFHLVDENGVLIFVASSTKDMEVKKFCKGKLKFTCKIPSGIMNEGRFNIQRLLLIKDKGNAVFQIRDLLSFDVISKSARLGWMGNKEGAVNPELEWDAFLEC